MEVAGGLKGGGAGDGDEDDRGGQQEQAQPGPRGEQRGDAARHLAGLVQVNTRLVSTGLVSTGLVSTGLVSTGLVSTGLVSTVHAGPVLPLLGNEAEGGHRG